MKKKHLAFLFFMVIACGQTLAQTQFQVVDGSTVSISGTSTISDWVVKSEKPEGTLVLEKSANKASSAGRIMKVSAVLPVETIKSERGETMDNKMYGALKKDAHPSITFTLAKPLEVKGSGKIAAAGEITIAGVTRPMTFDLNLAYANGRIEVSGKKSIKMTEFNVEPPTAMFGQIVAGDDVVVDLRLVFAPSPKQGIN